MRSRPAGVAATRRSSDRLTARSAAAGDPATAITSTSSCPAGHGHRRCSPPTPGKEGVKGAGQPFDAETESGPFSHPRSRTVSALRRGASALTATLTATATDSGRCADVCRDSFRSSEDFCVPSQTLWSSLGGKGSAITPPGTITPRRPTPTGLRSPPGSRRKIRASGTGSVAERGAGHGVGAQSRVGDVFGFVAASRAHDVGGRSTSVWCVALVRAASSTSAVASASRGSTGTGPLPRTAAAKLG